MATIWHQIAIFAPIDAVYRAIATVDGVGDWWDAQTAKKTDAGTVMMHSAGDGSGTVELLVVEQVKNQHVKWNCISSHPESSPASAWTGTHFVFTLSGEDSPAARITRSYTDRAADPLTTLDFRQEGYDEDSEYCGFNTFAWGQVLSNLKRVVEGG